MTMKHAIQQARTVFEAAELTFRKPNAGDGAAVHELISQCPPLDTNSLYCNLLQCTHFADSCVLVESGGCPVGFLSAYIPPDDPDTLFVWQVAVHADARGRGLGQRMLDALLDRPGFEHIERLQTTITRDNRPSWGLFESFAEKRGGNCHDEVLFCRKKHFSGRHASEHLLTIRFG